MIAWTGEPQPYIGRHRHVVVWRDKPRQALWRITRWWNQ